MMTMWAWLLYKEFDSLSMLILITAGAPLASQKKKKKEMGIAIAYCVSVSISSRMGRTCYTEAVQYDREGQCTKGGSLENGKVTLKCHYKST